MRKLCFVLTALLLAAPALAAVNISCQQVGTTTEVEVSYDSTGSLPRAFALDVTVDTGTITAISDVSSDFWVYPGTIQISGSTIVDEGEPIAPSDDPCALGGLGTSGITLEMGSLYSPNDVSHTTAPASSGKLLSITVSDLPCTLTITGNGARGNVVLEDTAAADTNLPVVCELVPPEGCWAGDATSKALWEAVGAPECWCASVNARQCHGDATGGLPEGKLSYYTSSGDLNVFLAAWNKDYPTIAGQTEPVSGALLICADFDRLPEGKLSYRCSSGDLNILLANWNTTNAPAADCVDITGSQE